MGIYWGIYLVECPSSMTMLLGFPWTLRQVAKDPRWILDVDQAVVDVTPGPVTLPSTWLRAFQGFPWTLRQVAMAPSGSSWTWSSGTALYVVEGRGLGRGLAQPWSGSRSSSLLRASRDTWSGNLQGDANLSLRYLWDAVAPKRVNRYLALNK